MKRLVILLSLCALAVALATAGAEEPGKKAKPFIQIALLLDTSNSMDGHIGQAKTQLWKIVNEFATAKKHGARPELQVALYEYGNDSLPDKEGYIRLVLPLTNDLDKVSEELFALTTNGGSEYCGKVIDAAIRALDWSDSPGDLKAVFIAGNEPFTQGGVDYRASCKAAVTKGVVVNTIFCGPHEEGIDTHWKDGAVLADGKYMNIDQDRAVVHISAPQDAEIAALGVALNETYVPYGAAGIAGQERQAEQDTHALSAAGAGTHVQRAVAKASAQYKNVGWDLIDAVQDGSVKIEELGEESLPDRMKNMTPEERTKYVQEMFKHRNELREKITELNDERKKYVAEEMKKLSETGEDTFDMAMIKALKEQAEQKGFRLD